MDNVMIDLETLGKNTNAVVTQIAAVYFDIETGALGETFDININLASEMKQKFQVDASTLSWWFSQSREAQRSAFGTQATQVESFMAWTRFATFLSDAQNIWCHATFDFPICSVHWRHYGIEPKFKYWAPKDLRSIVWAAGVDTRKYKRQARAEGATLHDALEDCKLQIRYLVDAMKILRGGQDGTKSRTEEGQGEATVGVAPDGSTGRDGEDPWVRSGEVQ